MTDEQKELEYYRKMFSVKDEDLAIKGYVAYVEFVKQQVDFISTFNVKSNIDGKKTETVLYDRAIKMGEDLPDMISKMNRLKVELNIQHDPEAGKPKVGATTPQSLSKVI